MLIKRTTESEEAHTLSTIVAQRSVLEAKLRMLGVNRFSCNSTLEK